MPKAKILQSNLSAGELSPQAAGRVDIARYPNAAKVMSNVISKALGGAKKRFGTQFIEETKDSTQRSRLVPYVIDRDTAYMLELGDEYVRVYKNDGARVEESPGIPYEISTPFDTEKVGAIDYAQGEDTMYVFHQGVYPHRLRTFGDAKWDCSPAPFTTTPFFEQGDYPAAELTLSANTVGTGRTMTADASVFMASDVDRAILWNAGIFVITSVTSGTEVVGEVKVVFDSTTIPTGEWNLDASPQATLTPGAKDPVGASITLVLSLAGWRAGDVGKFVRMNGGLIEVTEVSSGTAATGSIVKVLTSTTAAPALAWTLESSVWGEANGYPRTGTLYQQRLVVGGTKKNPLTISGSKTGEPLDFTKGTADDDAFVFTLDANRDTAGPINYLSSSRDLLVLTDGGEHSVRAGVEKPITPTNIQTKPEGNNGSSRVKPIRVGKEILFAQRAARKLRAMGFRYDEDGYKATDLTTLGEHLTSSGVAGMAFQQEPDPVVWVWLRNGRLVSLTLDRELDIIAWNRHETEGAVESVAVMPAGDREQVWMITRRLVDGQVVRYVERMQHDWYPIYGTAAPDIDALPIEDEPLNWGFTLDCAVTQDDAAGKETWTGLDHLEGKVVRCVADGVDMGELTVAGGAITLPRNAKRVLIGLMFRPTITLLTPEIQAGTGSTQADAISVNEMVLRVLDTVGLTVDGAEILPGRINGPAQLDKAPAPYTGIRSVSKIGWEKGLSEPTISQDAPFPFHLLSVVRSTTFNGG